MFEKIYLGDILIDSIFIGINKIQYGNDGPPILKFIININNDNGQY